MYNASTTSTTDQPREDPRIVQLRDNILANKLKWAFKIYYSSIKTCVSIMCKSQLKNGSYKLILLENIILNLQLWYRA